MPHTLPGPIVALTQQQLLDLMDRLLPPGYIDTLKSPGPGFEVLQSYAKIFERAAQAAETLGDDSQIFSSASAARAAGSVELFRAAAHPEAITVVVQAGTVVTTSNGGRDFVTLENVTFASAALGPFTVAIEAVAPGYEWNVTGQVTTADGTVLEGEIDAIKTLVEDPQLGDLTIQVRQITSTSGGTDAALDAIGADRGIERQPNETNDLYRRRVQQLPDTVSRGAIVRALEAVFDPINANFTLIETFEITYQTCWDAPSSVIAGSDFDPNLFVYDDPDLDRIPFRNRWLDENDFRGAFIVVVPNLEPLRDFGMAWDDTAVIPTDLVSPTTGGVRALSAYDVPISLGLGIQQGAYDGFDVERAALFLGLFDTLQEIKAGGVLAVLELEGQ